MGLLLDAAKSLLGGRKRNATVADITRRAHERARENARSVAQDSELHRAYFEAGRRRGLREAARGASDGGEELTLCEACSCLATHQDCEGVDLCGECYWRTVAETLCGQLEALRKACENVMEHLDESLCSGNCELCDGGERTMQAIRIPTPEDFEHTAGCVCHSLQVALEASRG